MHWKTETTQRIQDRSQSTRRSMEQNTARNSPQQQEPSNCLCRPLLHYNLNDLQRRGQQDRRLLRLLVWDQQGRLLACWQRSSTAVARGVPVHHGCGGGLLLRRPRRTHRRRQLLSFRHAIYDLPQRDTSHSTRGKDMGGGINSQQQKRRAKAASRRWNQLETVVAVSRTQHGRTAPSPSIHTILTHSHAHTHTTHTYIYDTNLHALYFD